jgi:hypothetical protein
MFRIVPRAYRRNHGSAVLVELATDRPIRTRNKLHYRIAHWPVWVFAFFIAPGPITFSLFASGPSPTAAIWFAAVAISTGIAAFFGKLPGTEAKPYVLLYGEDTPNPIHRRICYTVAWGGIISYALLNFITLVDAVAGGVWHSTQIFAWGYFPIVGVVWLLGIAGRLPRARKSTQGEGVERRQFYGAVWAVSVAQVLLLIMWKVLPLAPETTLLKFVVYSSALAGKGHLARRGLLPRTRPILPGTRAAAD